MQPHWQQPAWPQQQPQPPSPSGWQQGYPPASGQPYGVRQPWPTPAVPTISPELAAYPPTPQPFHHFWRAPRWRWWKSLVLLGVGIIAFFLLQFAAIFIAGAVDAATGRVPWSRFIDELQHGTVAITPAIFTANNVSLVALVPTAILLAWAVTRQRPGYLSSVLGRLRWGWMVRCMAFILPLWLLLVALQYLASRTQPDMALHVSGDTWPLIIAIVLTTPLQCAGEEFAFRGIINRSVASWFANPWVGFAAGGLVNSGLFMLAHGAGDPWLNVFYFVFGAIGTWLVWRTGGLEASIAVHVVNNLTAEWMLPFTDISGMFDRGVGTAGPAILVNAALPLLAVGIIEWRARREKIVRVSTPRALSASAMPPMMSPMGQPPQYRPFN